MQQIPSLALYTTEFSQSRTCSLKDAGDGGTNEMKIFDWDELSVIFNARGSYIVK